MTTLQSITLITASLHVREVVNGFLFVLCIDLALMISYFMWYTYRTVGGEKWRHADGMATACALAWVFGIVGFRCGLVWLVLWCGNRGYDLPWWFDQFGNIALIASACGLVFATLRATFIFTPPEWGNIPWIVSASSATAFCFLALSL